MSHGKEKLFRRADAVVIAVFLILAVITALFGFKRGSAAAEIICGGELLYKINLGAVKEPYMISLDNGIKIKVEKNAIGFIESDCPGLDCVKTGMLSFPGQTAACVPNKTVIKLKGEKKAGLPDAVSY